VPSKRFNYVENQGNIMLLTKKHKVYTFIHVIDNRRKLKSFNLLAINMRTRNRSAKWQRWNGYFSLNPRLLISIHSEILCTFMQQQICYEL
jgi:hypothetical protein